MRNLYLFLAILFLPSIGLSSQEASFEKVKESYIMEYTALIAKECFKHSSTKDKELRLGSSEFFDFMKKCFHDLEKKCLGTSDSAHCESYTEIEKRKNAISLINSQIELKPTKTIRLSKLKILGGSPNLDKMTKEELIAQNKTKEEMAALKLEYELYKKLRVEISEIDYTLDCEQDLDCHAESVGQRLCGGPEGYFIISKKSKNFDEMISTLAAFTKVDKSFQKKISGFGSFCSFEMKPKLICLKNKCK